MGAGWSCEPHHVLAWLQDDDADDAVSLPLVVAALIAGAMCHVALRDRQRLPGVRRRDHLRRGRGRRLRLCRQCGAIHRAGACRGAAGAAAERPEGPCAICLEAAVGGDGVVLRCGHAFHYDCVAPWCQEHGSCPLCRAPLQAHQ